MIDIFHYQNNSVKKALIHDLPNIKDDKLWIDITNISRSDLAILKEVFNLHPLTVEDLYHTGIRVKVEEFPNYLFCVFYGMVKNKRLELIELDFVINENVIISNHKKAIESFSKLKENHEHIKDLLESGTDFFLHKLLDLEIDNYFSVLEGFDDEIDHIEIGLSGADISQMLPKIQALKRNIISIRRVTYNQREKLGKLAKLEYKYIRHNAIPYFRDIYDNTIHVNDSVENYRESTQNLYEIYVSTLSNKMNEVMKTLSIIATIALPLTVISSVYGTNFDALPGQHYQVSFWIMLTIMVVLILGMVYYFWRRKWI